MFKSNYTKFTKLNDSSRELQFIHYYKILTQDERYGSHLACKNVKNKNAHN